MFNKFLIIIFSLLYFSCAQVINKETAAKTVSVLAINTVNYTNISTIEYIVINTNLMATDDEGCIFEVGATCSGSCYNESGTYTIEVEKYAEGEGMTAIYTYNNCSMPLSFCSAYTDKIPAIAITGSITDTTTISDSLITSTQKGNISVEESSCLIDIVVSIPTNTLDSANIKFSGTICSYSYQDLEDILEDPEEICSE